MHTSHLEWGWTQQKYIYKKKTKNNFSFPIKSWFIFKEKIYNGYYG